MSAEPGATRISSVAHLFLSELRGDQTSETGTVKRTKPTEDSHPPPPQQTDQPFRADPSYFSNRPDQQNGPALIAVVAAHLPCHGAKGLSQFARTLAGPSRVAALLKFESSSAHLRLFYHKDQLDKIATIVPHHPHDDEYGEDPLSSAGAPAQLPHAPADHIWQLLARITPITDTLLVAWGPEYQALQDALLRCAHSICVLVHPDEDHLIRSYQLVKSLASDHPDTSLGVFITEADDQNQANRILARFKQTAREFAGTDLIDFGYNLSDQAVSQELLCRTDLPDPSDVTRRDCIDRLQQYVEQYVPVDPLPEQKEDVPEPQVHTSSNPCTSSNGLPDLITVNLDDPTADNIINTLAEKLLNHATCCDDPLAQFLTNAGLPSRTVRTDTGESIMIFIRDDDDRQLASWALSNYPQTNRPLIIIAATPIDITLRRAWSQRFRSLNVLSALTGRLNDQPTLIIQK